MTTITNHEELIQYITAEGWKNISPTCYRYTLEREAFYLTIYINPFRGEHFNIFLTTPRGTEDETEFYEDEDCDESVIEKIQYQVERLQTKYEKWIKTESKTNILEVFKQRGATYNEEMGCYELQFENGKQLYLFALPNGYRYELSVSQNQKQTKWSHHIYDESDTENEQIRKYLSKIESLIPFLDGWVDKISQPNYPKGHYYAREFEEEGTPYREKANRFKDILFQYVSQDALYHVIPVTYNHDKEKWKDYLELEFYQKREYLTSIKESVEKEMQDVVKEFDFFHCRVERNCYLYYVDLQQVAEEQFIPLARKLGEKINVLL